MVRCRCASGRKRSAHAAADGDQDLHQHLRAGTDDLDGRPPAIRRSNAPATWQGFSTGKWDGDILTVYTTHIKQEWIRRNGVPNSEKSTMMEHFIRHGNYFTHLEQWTDPVYLTER